jgi:hypothetical protein
MNQLLFKGIEHFGSFDVFTYSLNKPCMARVCMYLYTCVYTAMRALILVAVAGTLLSAQNHRCIRIR